MIGKAEEFPERLLRAIPPGRNLDLAYHKICVLLLNEARKKADNKLAEPSIDKIIDLHTRILSSKNTGVVSEEEWYADTRSEANSRYRRIGK